MQGGGIAKVRACPLSAPATALLLPLKLNSQAIAAWRLASEPERLWICGAYVHYTGALLSSECIRHVL